jgi:hypothetical protein
MERRTCGVDKRKPDKIPDSAPLYALIIVLVAAVAILIIIGGLLALF